MAVSSAQHTLLVPRWFHARLWAGLFKKTATQGMADNIPVLSAALAFYAMLSIVPLLMLLISIVDWWYGNSNAKTQINDLVVQFAGVEAADSVQKMLLAVSAPTQNGLFATFLGLVTLFMGASGVFNQLQEVLNLIWRTPPRLGSALSQIIKERLLSFAIILGVGLLSIASIVVNAVLTVVLRFAGGFLPFAGLARVGNMGISFIILAFVFALSFRIIPSRSILWRDVWLGAFLTSLLFSLGQWLISFYLGYANIAAGYGAGGSLAALMIWVYYSAQIFFFGAEFTHVYATHLGSCRTK